MGGQLLRWIRIHPGYCRIEPSSSLLRHGGEVSIFQAGHTQRIACRHFKIEDDGRVGFPQRGDDARQVENASAEWDFAEQKAIVTRLYGHILEMHADRKRCERFYGGMRLIEQCDVIAGIHQDANPLAAHLAHECDKFVGGIVLVIFDGELQPVFAEHWLD